MRDPNEYRRYTKPAEMEKAIHTLYGIIEGMLMDGVVNRLEVNELRYWSADYSHLVTKEPFREILHLVDTALEDNQLTIEELEDIQWVCNKFGREGTYYDTVTCSLQELQGLCHGILADGAVNEEEMTGLHRWIGNHSYLSKFYPFDEIHSVLHFILQDGHVSDDEILMLKALFFQYADIRDYVVRSALSSEIGTTYNTKGFCAIAPEIVFPDSRFCFTGESPRAPRSQLQQFIVQQGGIPQNNVTKELHYLVVGEAGNPCWAYSCYGRKVEKALEYRKAGLPLLIVQEGDFWAAAGM